MEDEVMDSQYRRNCKNYNNLIEIIEISAHNQENKGNYFVRVFL